MFERYTERARRVLFFARYEASQMGATSIDTEHLLLGLLRESKGVIGVIFARADVAFDAVATELNRRAPTRQKVSTSVEMPFSHDVKQVLNFAAEEADALQDRHIGPEHMLLGLLRQEQSVSAQILGEHGLRLETVRRDVTTLVSPAASEPAGGASLDAAVIKIDQIKAMVVQLAQTSPGSDEAHDTEETILAALDALKDNLGG